MVSAQGSIGSLAFVLSAKATSKPTTTIYVLDVALDHFLAIFIVAIEISSLRISDISSFRSPTYSIRREDAAFSSFPLLPH